MDEQFIRLPTKTFENAVKSNQERLNKILLDEGISPSIISGVIDSGYFACNMMLSFGDKTSASPCVYDGLYGNKSPSSMIPIRTFCEYLNGKKMIYPSTSKVKVKSLKEATEVLSKAKHSRFSHRMCFRGQSKEYFIKRKVPNPVAADEFEKERLIIPSIYRNAFKPGSNPNSRTCDVGSSILRYAYDLIYDGIDWRTLHERNFKKYGLHSFSDIEDFEEEENKKYYKRRMIHEEVTSLDHILLEQHYGIDTHGLDVTFDLGTALFFATHDCINNKDGTSTFFRRESVKGSVVYCIVYEWPSVRESSDKIKETKIFTHIPPIRPIRQKCALPMFLSDKINETARDLDLILELEDPFDFNNLPSQEWLFPSADEDPFYKALLKEKEKGDSLFKQVIEYKYNY